MKIKPLLLGLSGGRGSGKTTIANYLVEECGYSKISFAEPVRDIVGIIDCNRNDDREILANVGIMLRSLRPRLLIEIVQEKISNTEGFIVVEDVRFPEEILFLKNLGATLIRLDISKEAQLMRLKNRDGGQEKKINDLTELMDEKRLDDFGEWDLEISGEGDLEKIANILHVMVESKELSVV